MTSYSLGIDIGGTFTDLVLIGADGSLWVEKVLSTPQDYSAAIITGVQSLLHRLSIEPRHVSRVVHASTIATNVILERKGSRIALVTTMGFRDILEMRRLRIPVLYDLQYSKPKPLVPRNRCFELSERTDADGRTVTALSEAELASLVIKLKDQGVESVAVCFLHSYANSNNERTVEAFLRKNLPEDVFICRSSDILPKVREYERCSTTVVNAYVGPQVRRYLELLDARLKGADIKCPIKIMHSSGGIMSIDMAQRIPVYLVESGPAAGVTGCATFSSLAGCSNVISFDMGGTTTKAAIIENRQPAKTDEYEVGSGISISSKLVKGGGYPIGLPFIDVSEIGAGGGSIVNISQNGKVSVGPASAGARPGPVCYDMGGEDPTLTDALVILGYINPDYLAGGSIQLSKAKAEKIFTNVVASPLNKSSVEAAHGVLHLAVSMMTRAVKAVSTYRGRDPRGYTLVAFGGNGPVVAVELAITLGMKMVLIPPASGVFSAVGLLVSKVEHEFVKSILGIWKTLTNDDVEKMYVDLEGEATQCMLNEGLSKGDFQLHRYAELRYSGQAYDLDVPVGGETFELQETRKAFDQRHSETYGHCSASDPVELVTLKVTARDQKAVAATNLQVREASADGGDSNKPRSRDVYFGVDEGYIATPILGRQQLTDSFRAGPVVIEDYDSTCVIPPGWELALDEKSNIHIRLID